MRAKLGVQEVRIVLNTGETVVFEQDADGKVRCGGRSEAPEPKPKPKSEQKPEPEPKPKPKSEQKPEPEPKPKPKSEQKPRKSKSGKAPKSETAPTPQPPRGRDPPHPSAAARPRPPHPSQVPGEGTREVAGRRPPRLARDGGQRLPRGLRRLGHEHLEGPDHEGLHLGALPRAGRIVPAGPPRLLPLPRRG
jgi:outer membrane biosynthesis protein TonB